MTPEMVATAPVEWRTARFAELTVDDLYAVLQARLAVFVVEQQCVYQDADGVDRYAHHIMGWRPTPSGQVLVAYCRLVAPGVKYAEPSIGRVITTAAGRGQGLGKELMRRALALHDALYPGQGNRISAQQYLERFYGAFGYRTVSAPYDEDGLPHVEMLRDGR
ncbi:MAG: GNAT family N-acetyltransferase [Chloracidobacterium sp.]|nr:GNAT family N-acetyltransferase [Chloracidobacterium sp.]MDW8217883.1 GNAT family N-acetyltransferase [Acidobacteriota bacterium]